MLCQNFATLPLNNFDASTFDNSKINLELNNTYYPNNVPLDNGIYKFPLDCDESYLVKRSTGLIEQNSIVPPNISRRNRIKILKRNKSKFSKENFEENIRQIGNPLLIDQTEVSIDSKISIENNYYKEKQIWSKNEKILLISFAPRK